MLFDYLPTQIRILSLRLRHAVSDGGRQRDNPVAVSATGLLAVMKGSVVDHENVTVVSGEYAGTYEPEPNFIATREHVPGRSAVTVT